MRIPPRFPHLRSLGVLVTVVTMSACISGGGRARVASTPAPPAASGDTAASPLAGEWQLTAYQMADGSSRRVTGYLRFDRFSNIALRAELAPDEPGVRPPRTVVAAFSGKAQADGDSFTYAGLAPAVGPDRLTDDAVNMAEWRHYELHGDTLRVFVRDGGGRAAATLVFQRSR